MRAYEWPEGTSIGDYGKFTWNDEMCGSGSRFVCQQYLGDYHKPVDKWLPNGPNNYGCKKGWAKFAGGCYALFGDKNSDEQYREKLSWESANQVCSQIWTGASLAIMPNVHYQWFVTSLLAEERFNNLIQLVWSVYLPWLLLIFTRLKRNRVVIHGLVF